MPNQFDMNFYQRPGGGQFQQFGGPFGGQFPPGGNNTWPQQFNQNEFPAYQGQPMAYNQPDMTFDNNSGIASFSRKVPGQINDGENEEGEPIDKETLKALRKEKKLLKKAAAQPDPSKPKEQSKAPSKFIFF
jgi:hypothetical protein